MDNNESGGVYAAEKIIKKRFKKVKIDLFMIFISVWNCLCFFDTHNTLSCIVAIFV